jgi:RimJ/RimL family protein N-acetyltransferase
MVNMTGLMPADLYTGKLVRLTAFRPEDKEALSRWTHDNDYMRNLDGDPARPRPASFFAELDRDKQREREANHVEFYIRTLAEDKLIGFADLNMQWNNQVGWLGIGIGEPEYRGKGYGSDALRLVVGYGFRELGLYRVSLGVFSYNERAIRAYEKVGFEREGTLRAALYRDGQRYDVIFMGILRPEWEKQVDN